MSLRSLLSQVRQSFAAQPASDPLAVSKGDERASTIPLDRPLSAHERVIAEWLLNNASNTARAFLPQLDHARVVGRCSCGCPTVDLKVAEGTPPAIPQDNPIGDAVGEVDGNMVGVMMFQRGGYLTCLEVYDLSDIEHPYPLPDPASLRRFEVAPMTKED